MVQYLISKGVSPRRLVAAGFGEFQPIDPGNTEEAFRNGEPCAHTALSRSSRYQTHGALDACPWARPRRSYPLPAEWTWQPTLNGRPLQAPPAFGNPLSFAFFETRDGRRITPTGNIGSNSRRFGRTCLVSATLLRN